MPEPGRASRTRRRMEGGLAAILSMQDCEASKGFPVSAEPRKGFAGTGGAAKGGRDGNGRDVPPGVARNGTDRVTGPGFAVRPGGWNRRGCGVTGASLVLLVYAQHALGFPDFLRIVVKDIPAFKQPCRVHAVVEERPDDGHEPEG